MIFYWTYRDHANHRYLFTDGNIQIVIKRETKVMEEAADHEAGHAQRIRRRVLRFDIMIKLYWKTTVHGAYKYKKIE